MTGGSKRRGDSDLRYSVLESGSIHSTHGTSLKAATINNLPTELFHHFLDLLDCADHATLASCTLVCRGWLAVSQQHLFSELHVLRSCDETFQSLVDWIEHHTTHAGYIRTLSLESRLVSAPPQASLMPSLPLDTLSHLLSVLPNLQALRLHQLKIEPPTALPTSYSLSGRYHLEHMEYEKCLCELSRTFELLSWFRLDHLDYDPLFADAKDPRLRPGDYALDVRSLCVSPITEDPLAVFRALQKFVRPKMLRSFRCPCTVAPVAVAEFLRGAGQCIVDIDLCASAEDDSDYLVLAQLPNLQVFRYHTCIPLLCAPASLGDHQAGFAPFKDSWIPHLPADLERFVLYIPYGEPGIAPGPHSAPFWGLEGVLAGRFCLLKKLTLVFPDLPADLATATAAAAACFPTFHERGILEVSVRSWELECREWDIYGYLHDW